MLLNSKMNLSILFFFPLDILMEVLMSNKMLKQQAQPKEGKRQEAWVILLPGIGSLNNQSGLLYADGLNFAFSIWNHIFTPVCLWASKMGLSLIYKCDKTEIASASAPMCLENRLWKVLTNISKWTRNHYGYKRGEKKKRNWAQFKVLNS